MLHARSLRIRHPNGTWLDLTAPLPPHMAKVWKMFGFDENDKRDPFHEDRAPAPRKKEAKPYDKNFRPRRGKERT